MAGMRQVSVRQLYGAVALVLVAALLLGVRGAEPGLASSTGPSRISYYLALGDSVPMWNGIRSYPYLILRHYQRKLPGLRLDDIAVSGETTSSMLGSQYPRGLRFLRSHKRHVALITIDIGGNDIVGCPPPAGLNPNAPCVLKALATIKRNLTVMLAGLHKAAPGVPVIGMNYYDPYLDNWLAGGLERALVISTLPTLRALNNELAALYGGIKNTANVQDAFHATDLTTLVPSPWGNIPIAVQRACAWLDIHCQQGGPEPFSDDPNTLGAAAIASVFERTLERQCTRKSSALIRRCRNGA